MGTYLLSLDQGTTSSRAILFNREQNILGVAQKEFTQFYPREGWVEHDPMEVWSSQYGVMMEVIAQSGVNPAEIAAIGITNQRETTILWDRATGRPIYNAIVWQCRRTAELVDRLRADGLEEQAARTGRATVTVPFDRQALADYLCVDRSALSRTIGALQREGVLTVRRDRFTLNF